MIRNRFDETQIEIDALRMIINRSLILPIIILVNGHGQIGKSTFVFHLANRILQIKKGIKNPTWNEWDWRKYATTTAYDFVKIYDESDNQILVLEEAGEQLNYLEWFSVMARVFASTTRTQGMHRNICMLVTPMSTDIQKHNKEYIDFKFWVAKRYDESRIAIIKPRYIKIDYLNDKWKLGYIKDWIIKYSRMELAKASEFTNWLMEYKDEIADINKMKVGIIKTKTKQELLEEKIDNEINKVSDWEKIDKPIPIIYE